MAPGAGAQPSLPPPRQALLSAQGVAGVSRSERLGQTDASLRRDGPDQGSPQLGVFSGNTALETAYSSGNRVLLQFHSDFSNGGFFVLNFHGERTSAPRARAGGGGPRDGPPGADAVPVPSQAPDCQGEPETEAASTSGDAVPLGDVSIVSRRMAVFRGQLGLVPRQV